MRLVWELTMAIPMLLKVNDALSWSSTCQDVHAASRDFRRKCLACSLCVDINAFFYFLLDDVWTNISKSTDALMAELNPMFNAPTGGISANLRWVLKRGFSPKACHQDLIPCPKDLFVHKSVTSRSQIASRLREIRQGGRTCLQSFYEELLPRKHVSGTIRRKAYHTSW